jgi:hypothetical protein
MGDLSCSQHYIPQGTIFWCKLNRTMMLGGPKNHYTLTRLERVPHFTGLLYVMVIQHNLWNYQLQGVRSGRGRRVAEWCVKPEAKLSGGCWLDDGGTSHGPAHWCLTSRYMATRPPVTPKWIQIVKMCLLTRIWFRTKQIFVGFALLATCFTLVSCFVYSST